MSHRVSVVIPVHDQSSYLADALRSVLRQPRPPDEIVVVDDGSEDGEVVERVVGEFGGDGTTLVRQEWLGAAAARNKGIEISSGSLVAFLDADDIWYPGLLESLCRTLDAGSDVVLASASADGFRARPYPLEDRGLKTSTTLARLFMRNHICTSTVVMRREELVRAGCFNPDRRVLEDYDLWLRVAELGRCIRLESPLGMHRVHSDSLSHTRPLEAARVMVEILEGALARNPGLADELGGLVGHRLAYAHRKRGKACLGAGRKAEARRSFAAAIRHRPISPRLHFCLLRSLLPV